MQHHHHPCNRFGFGLNPHQVNYQMQHVNIQHHTTNYHQNHPSNYSSGSTMVHSHHPHHPHHQHKPTNPWPTVPVSMPVNVSLPQQFSNNSGNNTISAVPAVRDLPLTPPADREGSSVPVVSSSPSSYYTMLHGPSMTSNNNNLMGNYSQSPVDKSMTPPQDPSSLHQHQHQQQAESINPTLGWWSPANSAVPSAVPSAGQSDYTFHHHHHHHQMLSHHSTIQAPTASSVPDTSRTSTCPSATSPHQNPSEFQQRVAAALLKTHATLASRRCRRCRCPNCQVNYNKKKKLDQSMMTMF